MKSRQSFPGTFESQAVVKITALPCTSSLNLDELLELSNLQTRDDGDDDDEDEDDEDNSFITLLRRLNEIGNAKHLPRG